jgi:hypothetical protein
MSLAPLDLENTSGALNQPKVIYAGDAYQGQPYIVVTEDGIILVGDANTVVNVGPEFGVLLSGKLSLSAMPDQIAIGGGYWRLNPLLTSCVPSTGAITVVLTWCPASRPHKYSAHARWPAPPLPRTRDGRPARSTLPAAEVTQVIAQLSNSGQHPSSTSASRIRQVAKQQLWLLTGPPCRWPPGSSWLRAPTHRALKSGTWPPGSGRGSGCLQFGS